MKADERNRRVVRLANKNMERIQEAVQSALARDAWVDQARAAGHEVTVNGDGTVSIKVGERGIEGNLFNSFPQPHQPNRAERRAAARKPISKDSAGF